MFFLPQHKQEIFGRVFARLFCIYVFLTQSLEVAVHEYIFRHSHSALWRNDFVSKLKFECESIFIFLFQSMNAGQ